MLTNGRKRAVRCYWRFPFNCDRRGGGIPSRSHRGDVLFEQGLGSGCHKQPSSPIRRGMLAVNIKGSPYSITELIMVLGSQPDVSHKPGCHYFPPRPQLQHANHSATEPPCGQYTQRYSQAGSTCDAGGFELPLLQHYHGVRPRGRWAATSVDRWWRHCRCLRDARQAALDSASSPSTMTSSSTRPGTGSRRARCSRRGGDISRGGAARTRARNRETWRSTAGPTTTTTTTDGGRRRAAAARSRRTRR